MSRQIVKRTTLTLTTIAVLAGGGFVTLKAYAGPKQGIIPEGVAVAGIALGGKPTSDAREALEAWSRATLSEKVTLSAELPSGRTVTWSPTRETLGLALDVDATVRKAESSRADDSTWTQLKGVFGSAEPLNIQPEWTLDPARTRTFLKKQVAPRVLRKPKPARFLATKQTFQIVPDEPGIKLDLDGAVAAIDENLRGETVEAVQLPLETAYPRIAGDKLKAIEGEVSHFQTHYGERGNRRKNIETACSRINGTVLLPGDIFSYNEVVGPRDAEAGYKMAPVIIRGRLEPGIGGGICQTSSTLYNAVLIAGLKIVRRSHHAFPVHYVPAGRDATVAYGSVDFKFQNDTDSPIAISANGSGGMVTMRVFGRKVAGREIRIERTNASSWGAPVKVVTDRSLPPGKRSIVDKGHSGHRVKVWRIVKQNGTIAKRELISSDTYSSFPRVVAVGAGAAAPSKQSATKPFADRQAVPSTQAPNPSGIN